MGLGGVLALTLSLFTPQEEAPAVCRFATVEAGGHGLSVTLQPVRTARSSVRGADAVMVLEGARLDAVVRPNTATEADDLLVTAADREGRRVVLAVHHRGAALLVREQLDAPATRVAGRCEGGALLERWFAG